MEWPDWAVFLAAVLLSAGTGFFSSFSSSGSVSSHLLTGGNLLGPLPLALSLLSSFASPVTILGQSAESYKYGPQGVFILGLPAVLLAPLLGYTLVPFFRSLNYTSSYQYLSERFGPKVEFLATFLVSLQAMVYMAVVLYAPSIAINQVAGCNPIIVTFVMFAVCIFYTTLGGFRAVVWADCLQMLLVFAALVGLCVRGTLAAGGFVPLVETLQANRTLAFSWSPDPRQRYTVWSSSLGTLFLYLGVYGGNQVQIQRYQAARSDKDARLMLWINGLGWSFLSLMTAYTGILMYREYSSTCQKLQLEGVKGGEQLLIDLVSRYLAGIPGMTGLFISGIFSAGLSSVSTGLNSLSVMWLSRTPPRLVLFLPSLFGLFSFLIVFLMPYLGSFVQVSVSTASVSVSSIFALFILGIYFPRVNYIGAVSGLLSSLVLVSALVFWSFADQSPSLCPQSDFRVSSWGSVSFLWHPLLSFLITIVVSLVASSISTTRQYVMVPTSLPDWLNFKSHKHHNKTPCTPT